MATDQIRYDLLAQDALRGVVRRVLSDAARDGLPGEHHFYISFRTRHPGVRISTRMAEKYPDEITIVLQHQFWDLSVNDQTFEVGLSFGGAPERLLVPFDAVSGFFDPSVQFGLKFEVDEQSDGAETGQDAAAIEESVAPMKARADKLAIVKPDAGKEPEADGAGEKIVSLETFRKKK